MVYVSKGNSGNNKTYFHETDRKIDPIFFYLSKERLNMLTTFKVTLMIILIISALGTIGTNDKHHRINLCSLAVASMAALTIMFTLM